MKFFLEPWLSRLVVALVPQAVPWQEMMVAVLPVALRALVLR